MKKLLMIVCSVAMLSIVSLAQVQAQDQQAPPVQDDAGAQESDQALPPTEETTPPTDETTPPTDQATPPAQEPTDQSTDMSEATPVDDKTGPNGEQIYMKNNKYFYLNESGEKVKIKEAELKDKTQ